MVYFSDGTSEKYERLISSIPLPEIVEMIEMCPTEVLMAAKELHYTCGYQVSLGFKRSDIAKHLWFYIYDEDIPPARVYSPNLKSPDNVPEGCSSLQAEVFFDNHTQLPSADVILKKTIEKLKKICCFTDDDIIVNDIRFEPYANVTFVDGIYKNRQIVLDYLKQKGIETIGRFGKWEYFWTFQAFADGMGVVVNE